MALLGSNSEIGPNSMVMFSEEQQEFDDYCTGEILISAIEARSDYQCTTASPESFASLGPFVQQEASNSINQTQQNIVSQSSITQDLVDAFSVPTIADSTIQNAPNAVAIGTPGATSPFTQGQLNAAANHPINWPATLTVQAAMQRGQRFRKMQASRQLFAGPQTQGQMQGLRQQVQNGGGNGGGAGQGARIGGNMQQGSLPPAAGWGSPCGSKTGWCGGLENKPWGKLLLFTGLGLLGAYMLERKGR